MSEDSFWVAVCEGHFEEHYDDEKDGYAAVEETYTCDVEGCEEEAHIELYKNLFPISTEPFYVIQDMDVNIHGMSWRLIRERKQMRFPLMEQFDVKYL